MATVQEWWLVGNTLAWLTIVVVMAVDIFTIRRNHRRMATFQHAFSVLAQYVQNELADPGRPLPMAVTEYLRAHNASPRRRRRLP